MHLGRLAIGASLAEDTSSRSKIRTPGVCATQKMRLVYRNILNLDVLNRVDNFDRIRTGDHE